MTSSATTSNPSLRHRIPLYPTQIVGAMVMASLGPLLDPMMSELGFPLSRGGFISGGFFLGSVIGVILVNTTLARFPAKWTLVGGTVLQGIGLVLAGAVSWDLWSLSLAFLLIGVGGSLMNTICWVWLSSHMRQNVAASALFMILFFAFGMMITPLVLGMAVDQGATWRWILAAEGGLTVAMALASAVLPLLDIPSRRSVRLSHLREVYAHNRGLLLGITGAAFMYTGAETCVNVWLPKFQIDVFGSSDTWAGLSVTLFWVGLVVGRIIVARLTRRFAPSRLLLVCGCTLAVFCVAVALVPSQVASLVLCVGAGLGASASYALIGSYAGRFPEWQSGVASSVFILLGGAGSIALPYVMGPLASAAGFRVALAAVAIPAVACALFSLLIHARAGEGRS